MTLIRQPRCSWTSDEDCRSLYLAEGLRKTAGVFFPCRAARAPVRIRRRHDAGRHQDGPGTVRHQSRPDGSSLDVSRARRSAATEVADAIHRARLRLFARELLAMGRALGTGFS